MSNNELLAALKEWVLTDDETSRLALADALAEKGEDEAANALRKKMGVYYFPHDESTIFDHHLDNNLIALDQVHTNFSTEGERRAYIDGLSTGLDDNDHFIVINEEDLKGYLADLLEYYDPTGELRRENS